VTVSFSRRTLLHGVGPPPYKLYLHNDNSLLEALKTDYSRVKKVYQMHEPSHLYLMAVHVIPALQK
jgi:hypothetical protein